MNVWTTAGTWYKGNLHTHTTNSDGALSPQEMVRQYEAKGYDFLAITDHDQLTDTSELESSLTFIPGEEVTANFSDLETRHLVALNLREKIPMSPGTPVQEMINRIRAAGGEVIIGHPYWSGIPMEELQQLQGYLGIEIFNTSCHYHIAKGYSLAHWDNLLGRGRRVLGFASDDAHYHFNEHRPVDTAVSFVMVKAKSRSVEDLMAAIGAGHFYASNGPEIQSIELEGDTLTVRTSPARSINIVAQNQLGESFTAPTGSTICEARCQLRGGETYLRVECWGGDDRWAWSNPVITA
jgi:hypothetical protein